MIYKLAKVIIFLVLLSFTKPAMGKVTTFDFLDGSKVVYSETIENIKPDDYSAWTPEVIYLNVVVSGGENFLSLTFGSMHPRQASFPRYGVNNEYLLDGALVIKNGDDIQKFPVFYSRLVAGSVRVFFKIPNSVISSLNADSKFALMESTPAEKAEVRFKLKDKDIQKLKEVL